MYLNHLYVVLDESTFNNLCSSDFVVNEFASVDTGLPDFLPPNRRLTVCSSVVNTPISNSTAPKKFKAPVGNSGIGMSTEQQGAIDQMYVRLENEAPSKVQSKLVHWNDGNGSSVPWYTVVYRDQPDSTGFTSWVSEYHEYFLPALYPDLGSEARGIRREDFLAPQFDDECCLRDIIEITVALHEPQKSRYIHELELLGCVSRAEADEVVLEGPNLRMVVTDATTERDGVLEMALLD